MSRPYFLAPFYYLSRLAAGRDYIKGSVASTFGLNQLEISVQSVPAIILVPNGYHGVEAVDKKRPRFGYYSRDGESGKRPRVYQPTNGEADMHKQRRPSKAAINIPNHGRLTKRRVEFRKHSTLFR